MKLFDKIKLFIKGNQVISQLSHVKRGYKTLSFWITLLASLGSFAGSIKGVVSPEISLIVTTALTALYNILRGLEKADEPGTRPWYKSTETWVGIGAQVQNACLAIKEGGIQESHLAAAAIVIGGVMSMARDLSNIQPSLVNDVKQ